MKRFLVLTTALVLVAWVGSFSTGGTAVPLGATAVDPVTLTAEDAVVGEVVVDVVDGAGPDDLAELGRKVGAALEPVSPQSEIDKMEVVHVAPERVAEVVKALSADPRVQAAEPNFLCRAYYEPNDPRFKEQWHMKKVRAPEAWDVTTGKGVTVAVIDTGVAYEKHGQFFQVEDLAGTEFVKGYNFLTGEPHGNDDNGHGTHVAGTIAQATNNKVGVVGIAYGCKIMPLKVLSRQGSGTVAHIAQAIRYAADNGAKVINMSLGGPFPSRVLEQACDYAKKKKGVIIVCAAGNEKRDRVGYPAGYESCVAVSATGPEDELAFYSNFGKKVAIAAPGGDKRFGDAAGVLQNTINPMNGGQDYFWFQGTSMASPHVAGAAALVISMGISDPDKVLKVLQATARKRDDPLKYGAGIVDCYAAVRKAKVHEDWWRFGIALVMAFLTFRWAWAGRGSRAWPTPGFLAGLLTGACGFFFLPLAGRAVWPLGGLATTGFPQWDILFFGAESHANPVFYSVAMPILLAVLCFGFVGARRFVAGFSAGVGAHLLHAGLFGLCQVQGCFGLDKTWLITQAALCLGLAVVLVRGLSDEGR